MLLLKALLYISLCYIVYGSDSTERIEALLSSPGVLKIAQKAIKAAYDENKLDLISSLVNELQEDLSNVTLVGSQNIYGPNGEVVEVRTVELFIPEVAKNKDVIGFHKSDKGEDEEVDDEAFFAEFKRLFDLTSKLGFSMELAIEQYDKNQNLQNKAYYSKNSLYGYIEGIYLLNKTIEVDTIKVVNDRIKELKANHLPVAVHKYDAKAQFVSEESDVIPEYIISILSEEGDVNQELLDEAQKGLATVFLKYQNNQSEVPKKLSEYLAVKYPEVDFNVFVNEPKAWYVNKDYKINLRYDLTAWDSSEEFTYSVFGLKKEEKATEKQTAAE